jgi:hypothetical protein
MPLSPSSSRRSPNFPAVPYISQANHMGYASELSARTLIENNLAQGRYLPVFASEIYDQNQVALRQGRPTINLQSVLIGNGITDISTYVFAPYENMRSSADI